MVGGGFLRGLLILAVCSHWYPIVRNLHRFFIATARAAVNDDDLGGSAIDPCVRSAGSVPKRRKVWEGVRYFALGHCLCGRRVRHVFFWQLLVRMLLLCGFILQLCCRELHLFWVHFTGPLC